MENKFMEFGRLSDTLSWNDASMNFKEKSK